MGFKKHIQLMTKYNSRMNEQIYNASSRLSEDELRKDVGAFFGSVLGTLNHIFVGDLIWLSRFVNHSKSYASLKKLELYPVPKSLDHIVFLDFSELYKARKALDITIEQWGDELQEGDFKTNLSYKNTKGVEGSRNFGELVLHLLNHQTHHRGQVSVLLSQVGLDIGVTDFLIDIPDEKVSSYP